MSKPKQTSVKILSKAYQVFCPAGAEEELQAAALYLDQKMRDIRNNGRVIGIERIAVMAALNITHELLSLTHQREHDTQTVSEQINRLQKKLEESLSHNETYDNI